MNAAELSQVVPGFDHPATDSQAVFRRVLDALSPCYTSIRNFSRNTHWS